MFRRLALIFGLAGSLHAAGLIITPTFDSTITNDPNSVLIIGTINQAIAIYNGSFSDAVNVKIKFQEMGTGLGQSSTAIVQVSYTSYLAQLAADATTANDSTALTYLPNSATSPVDGN